MALSKVIPLGNNGSITLGQAEGKATVALSAQADAGGGDLKGFAKVSVTAQAEVEEEVLIDAGFAALESKFAGNVAVIGGLEALKGLIEGVAAK